MLAVLLAGIVHAWMHAASVDGLKHFTETAETTCPAEKLAGALPFTGSPLPAAGALPTAEPAREGVATLHRRSPAQPRAPPVL